MGPALLEVTPGGAELLAAYREATVPGAGEPDGPGRRLIGITGSPGSGKSTLAAALGASLGVPVVPMDGFHLADVELGRRGLRERKGAPETFDAWGYAALLSRLAERPTHTVLAPAFDRTLEEPVAGSVPVHPDDQAALTEGNYLLLDEPAWLAARACLDAVWHLRVPAERRRAWLVERHVHHGRTPQEARAWVEEVDEPNARLVELASERADLLLDLSAWDWRLTG